MHLELIPYLHSLAIQLLIKIMNTVTSAMGKKNIWATDLALPFLPFMLLRPWPISILRLSDALSLQIRVGGSSQPPLDMRKMDFPTWICELRLSLWLQWGEDREFWLHLSGLFTFPTLRGDNCCPDRTDSAAPGETRRWIAQAKRFAFWMLSLGKWHHRCPINIMQRLSWWEAL